MSEAVAVEWIQGPGIAWALKWGRLLKLAIVLIFMWLSPCRGTDVEIVAEGAEVHPFVLEIQQPRVLKRVGIDMGLIFELPPLGFAPRERVAKVHFHAESDRCGTTMSPGEFCKRLAAV